MGKQSVEKYMDVYRSYIGKEIVHLYIDDNDVLHIIFGGGELKVYDDGQQCCEKRYMCTADDLDSFVGSTFLGIHLRGVTIDEIDWCGYREIQFVHISTSLGTITLETYNEHNGYYGGFNVVVEEMV